MALSIDTYTRALQALDYIAQGHTIVKACSYSGLSTRSFRRALKDSTELQEAFKDAEDEGRDNLADMLLSMDDAGSIYGSSDPAKMKIISDNIKWYLARKSPQKYGDRMTVDHNITADRAIIEALSYGRDRALGIALEPVDAEFEVIEAAPAVDLSRFGL